MENDTFDIRQFAQYVCASLGSSWTVKELTGLQDENNVWHYADIVDSVTGAKLCFTRVWGQTRTWGQRTHVHISGQFDNRDAQGNEFWNLPYNVSRPTINSAIAKGPAKVANDITKRLLPEYTPLLNACKTAWDAHGKATSNLHMVSDRLASDLGGRVTYEQYEARINLYQSVAFPNDIVDITVRQYPSYDGPNVRISGLDVTAGECNALFTLLAEMRGKMLVLAEMRDGKKL